MNAVHRVGVAGLAERDDPAVLDADVGLHDAPVVQHDRAGDHEVGRALCRGPQRLAHRFADDFAAAEHRLVAGESGAATQIVFDLDEQVSVGQPNAVARGRPVERGVSSAGQDRAHDAPAVFAVQTAEAGGDAGAGVGDELDVDRDTGFETHAGPGRHGQAATYRGVAIELQGLIRFGEVEVRTDLHGAVAGVQHGQRDQSRDPRATRCLRRPARPHRERAARCRRPYRRGAG